MSYNPLEELKKGNCSFLSDLTSYDRDTTIKRIRKSFERNVIIDGFLYLIINEAPYFCFNVIYDNPLYSKETLYLLDKYIGPQYMGTEMFKNFFSSPIAEAYVFTHFDEMLIDDKKLDILFSFLFNDYKNHREFISFLRLHPNLHIRARFMIYIANNHPILLNAIYDDFMKYLTSYTHQEYEQLTFLPTLMDKEDISILAVTLAQKTSTLPYYYKLKEYILKTYPTNDLAKYLVNLGESSDYSFNKELNNTLMLEDIDRLFLSSYNQKLNLYLNKRYTEKISKEIREKHAQFLAYFDKRDSQAENSDYSSLIKIYYYGLEPKLKELLDKYLSLSKDTSYEYLRCGSTAYAFRIGDFVFKLCVMKWSYEDIICPNLYLILENQEEMLIRNPKDNHVSAGIEVQRYLKRDANNVPSYVFDLWEKALHDLGWWTSDSIMHGNCGDNCRMLDSYKDAYTNNPEGLPDWFKEYPVVSVDRDRYYRLTNVHHRKEIPEYWGD